MAVDVIKQVVSGLVVAHSASPPIVHRDIKPQNILVGYSDNGLRAKIADFGLAKKFNVLTMALTGLGTRIFKPPEVLINLKSDSPAGDVWAVGTCLYLLLTDRFPFDDDLDLEDFEKGRFEQPLRSPCQLNVSIDEHLESIVYRCLALNVKERYQNAMELKVALDAWVPGKKRCKGKTLDFGHLSDTPKTAMSSKSTPDEDGARKMAADALKMSRFVGKLNEAADLMEEAFNKWPKLREEYEYKVIIWRKGISG
jgi:serine/threonine-protein kinase